MKCKKIILFSILFLVACDIKASRSHVNGENFKNLTHRVDPISMENSQVMNHGIIDTVAAKDMVHNVVRNKSNQSVVSGAVMSEADISGLQVGDVVEMKKVDPTSVADIAQLDLSEKFVSADVNKITDEQRKVINDLVLRVVTNPLVLKNDPATMRSLQEGVIDSIAPFFNLSEGDINTLKNNLDVSVQPSVHNDTDFNASQDHVTFLRKFTNWMNDFIQWCLGVLKGKRQQAGNEKSSQNQSQFKVEMPERIKSDSISFNNVDQFQVELPVEKQESAVVEVSNEVVASPASTIFTTLSAEDKINLVKLKKLIGNMRIDSADNLVYKRKLGELFGGKLPENISFEVLREVSLDDIMPLAVEDATQLVDVDVVKDNPGGVAALINLRVSKPVESSVDIKAEKQKAPLTYEEIKEVAVSDAVARSIAEADSHDALFSLTVPNKAKGLVKQVLTAHFEDNVKNQFALDRPSLVKTYKNDNAEVLQELQQKDGDAAVVARVNRVMHQKLIDEMNKVLEQQQEGIDAAGDEAAKQASQKVKEMQRDKVIVGSSQLVDSQALQIKNIVTKAKLKEVDRLKGIARASFDANEVLLEEVKAKYEDSFFKETGRLPEQGDIKNAVDSYFNSTVVWKLLQDNKDAIAKVGDQAAVDWKIEQAKTPAEKAEDAAVQKVRTAAEVDITNSVKAQYLKDRGVKGVSALTDAQRIELKSLQSKAIQDNQAVINRAVTVFKLKQLKSFGEDLARKNKINTQEPIAVAVSPLSDADIQVQLKKLQSLVASSKQLIIMKPSDQPKQFASQVRRILMSMDVSVASPLFNDLVDVLTVKSQDQIAAWKNPNSKQFDLDRFNSWLAETVTKINDKIKDSQVPVIKVMPLSEAEIQVQLKQLQASLGQGSARNLIKVPQASQPKQFASQISRILKSMNVPEESPLFNDLVKELTVDSQGQIARWKDSKNQLIPKAFNNWLAKTVATINDAMKNTQLV
jgi:hypothetical protein